MSLRLLDLSEMKMVSGAGASEGDLWSWFGAGGSSGDFEEWMRDSLNNIPADHASFTVSYAAWLSNQNPGSWSATGSVGANGGAANASGGGQYNSGSSPNYSQYDYSKQVCGSCHN